MSRKLWWGRIKNGGVVTLPDFICLLAMTVQGFRIPNLEATYMVSYNLSLQSDPLLHVLSLPLLLLLCSPCCRRRPASAKAGGRQVAGTRTDWCKARKRSHSFRSDLELGPPNAGSWSMGTTCHVSRQVIKESRGVRGGGEENRGGGACGSGCRVNR